MAALTSGCGERADIRTWHSTDGRSDLRAASARRSEGEVRGRVRQALITTVAPRSFVRNLSAALLAPLVAELRSLVAGNAGFRCVVPHRPVRRHDRSVASIDVVRNPVGRLIGPAPSLRSRAQTFFGRQELPGNLTHRRAADHPHRRPRPCAEAAPPAAATRRSALRAAGGWRTGWPRFAWSSAGRCRTPRARRTRRAGPVGGSAACCR